jgi:hypothetical protein
MFSSETFILDCLIAETVTDLCEEHHTSRFEINSIVFEIINSLCSQEEAPETLQHLDDMVTPSLNLNQSETHNSWWNCLYSLPNPECALSLPEDPYESSPPEEYASFLPEEYVSFPPEEEYELFLLP